MDAKGKEFQCLKTENAHEFQGEQCYENITVFQEIHQKM